MIAEYPEEKPTLGEIAYSAYGKWVDYKNFQGNPMPKWDTLPIKIQDAWQFQAEQIYSLAFEEGKNV